MGNVHGADRPMHTWDLETIKELFWELKKLGICVTALAGLMGFVVCLRLKSLGNVHGADHRVPSWKAIKEKLLGGSKKPRICVAGAASLMGSAICQRLKSQGHYVIACDWMKDELLAKDKYWDEYHVIDTTDPTDQRFMDKCLEVTRGVDLVFNFATSGGGRGFGEYDLSATKGRDTTIGYNMAEAARINGVRRFFHASIIYPLLTEPQWCTGFEATETEKLCKRYYEDVGFDSRIGRFYCFYGPLGTWEGEHFNCQRSWLHKCVFCSLSVAHLTGVRRCVGGRGEARAAVRGEPSISTAKFGMGDGPHPIIDIYVEKLLSLMESDSHEPVDIGILNMREPAIMGSDEIVSEN